MNEFTGSYSDFQQQISQTAACLVYCSTADCSVCIVLKPKIEELIKLEFPRIKPIFLSLNQYPEIAGQYRIFTAPSILVFFNGQEFMRKSRAFGVEELKRELSRPYQLLFF